MGEQVLLFSAGGGSMPYTPAFHVSFLHPLVLASLRSCAQYPADLKAFQAVHEAVERSLVQGQPAWRVDPDNSSIRILSRAEIEALEDEEVQAIFRKQHVVVPDQFVPKLAFDEKGLRTLADLNKLVTVHGERPALFFFPSAQGIADHSKRNAFKADACLRHRNGTLQGLLDSDRSGLKILNALDFPMASAPHPPTAFSSDLVAFTATVDLPFCGRSVGFPAMSCRWGLGATRGAHHLWHIDCDGFATYLDTQVGSKWWVLARPKEPFGFSDAQVFSTDYELDGSNEEKWMHEAILLTPGSRL